MLGQREFTMEQTIIRPQRQVFSEVAVSVPCCSLVYATRSTFRLTKDNRYSLVQTNTCLLTLIVKIISLLFGHTQGYSSRCETSWLADEDLGIRLGLQDVLWHLSRFATPGFTCDDHGLARPLYIKDKEAINTNLPRHS